MSNGEFQFLSDRDSDYARTFSSLAKSDGGWKSEAQAKYWLNEVERIEKVRAESGEDYGIGWAEAWFRRTYRIAPDQVVFHAEGGLYFPSSHTGNLTTVGARRISWFYVVDGKGLVYKYKAGHLQGQTGLKKPWLEFARGKAGDTLPDYWAQIKAKRAEVAKIRESEYLAAEVAPAGRVEVQGVVITEPEYRSAGSDRYGHNFGAFKCLVKDDRGFKVWVSVPSNGGWQKGDQVRFKVTLTPSEDDPKFAFGKRPTIEKEAS